MKANAKNRSPVLTDTTLTSSPISLGISFLYFHPVIAEREALETDITYLLELTVEEARIQPLNVISLSRH